LRKGWGYGKNYLSQGGRLYDSSIKTIDNDKMTVYKGSVIYMGYIDVEIIIFKNSNIKRVGSSLCLSTKNHILFISKKPR